MECANQSIEITGCEGICSDECLELLWRMAGLKSIALALVTSEFCTENWRMYLGWIRVKRNKCLLISTGDAECRETQIASFPVS